MNDKKLVSIKTDGALHISVDNKLFQKIRDAHTWYTSKYISIPAIIVFFVIDILGFGQIVKLTRNFLSLGITLLFHIHKGIIGCRQALDFLAFRYFL